MPDYLAASALVAGFFLAVGPLLPARAPWARAAVAGGVLWLVGRYVAWRITATLLPIDLTTPGLWRLGAAVVEALLVADTALLFLLLMRVVDRSVEADAHEAVLRAAPPVRLPHVDVFIPTFDEGLDVLERTIVCALAIDYPDFAVWVLDDGGRDWLCDFCRRKGARYLRRPDNLHAKAGNINHALGHSGGAYIAVFDADFVPYTNFIYRTLGFFDDPRVGCVQTPQHFFNKDPIQLNLGLERVWPDEQRLFFHTIMPSRDAWGCAFCCGSCMIVRRAVLAELGGMPVGSVTEDVLMTLMMLRRGWKTVYLDEELSAGLAPESIEAFFVQRKRWCRGNIQMLLMRDGPLGPGRLGLATRLFFLPTFWLLQPVQLLFLAIPLVFMWSGVSPLSHAGPADLARHQVPALLACFLALSWVSRGAWLPLLSTASTVFAAIRLSPTVLFSLVRPFGAPFRVTPKGRRLARRVFDRNTALIAAALLGANLGGILINLDFDLRVVRDDGLFRTASIWSLWNCLIFLLVFLISVERPRRRADERFVVGRAAPCTIFDAQFEVQVLDISMSGARLQLDDGPALQQGARIALDLDSVGTLRGRVVWTSRGEAGLRFEALSAATRETVAGLLGELARAAPQRPERSLRIALGLTARCSADEAMGDCVIENASLTGALLDFSGAAPPHGAALALEFPDVGILPCRVVRSLGAARVGVHFEEAVGSVRDRLIKRLYAVPIRRSATVPAKASAVLGALARRAFGSGPA